MVQAEQVGELVGVLGAPLHGVEEGELAVQQDLVPAGEVDEHLGDAAPHVGLLDGGLDSRALQGVQGLAHLAHLVAAALQAGRLGLDVDLLTGGQPAHDAGQAHAGDLVRVLAEPLEVADEGAADADRDEQRGEQGEEAEHTGRAGAEHDPHRLGTHDVVLIAVGVLLAEAVIVVRGTG